MADQTTARDLPSVSDAVDARVRDPLNRVIEEMRRLLGFRGDQLDSAITFRRAIGVGLVDSSLRAQTGDVTIINNPPGGGGGGGTPTPDNTPPPTPTGFSGSAGFTSIILVWDPPIYTQGTSHGQTNVYAVKRPIPDPNPPPTFGDAALVHTVYGPTTITSIPSELNTRWHLWIKWQTAPEGVESVNPAGGINGLVLETGQDITQLLAVLSQRITTSELSTILASRIDLIDGNGAGSVNARIASEAAIRQAADSATAATLSTLSASVGANTAAIQAEQTVRANETGALFGRLTWKIDLNGFVTGFGLASSLNTDGPTSDFLVRADRISFVPPVNYSSASTSPPGSPTVGQVWYQTDTKVFRRWSGSTWEPFNSVPFSVVTAPFSERGVTIPAGTYIDAAFIRNLSALVARFGTAWIDDAMVSNLSAAKLTAGDGTIGGDLKSANFVAGSSGWRLRPDGTSEFPAVAIRGQLVASQIDGRNLALRDAAGNVILAQGTLLAPQYADPGLRNSELVPSITSAQNTANSAVSGLADKLNKSTADILSGQITLQSSGAIVAGTVSTGVVMSPAGLLGRKAGATTFAIDAATGDVSVSGLITGSTIIGSSLQTATSGARVEVSSIDNSITFYTRPDGTTVEGALRIGGPYTSQIVATPSRGRTIDIQFTGTGSGVTRNGVYVSATNGENIYSLADGAVGVAVRARGNNNAFAAVWAEHYGNGVALRADANGSGQAALFNGPVQVNGALTLSGGLSLGSSLQVTGSLSSSGTFGVNGNGPQGKYAVRAFINLGGGDTTEDMQTLVNQLRQALINCGICQ